MEIDFTLVLLLALQLYEKLALSPFAKIFQPSFKLIEAYSLV